jgi:hypothetical protein
MWAPFMRVPSNILPARLEAVPSLNERRLIKLTETGAVGLRVGEAVGFLDGAHVGDTVGFLEGLVEGILVGGSVGVAWSCLKKRRIIMIT